MSCRKEIDSGLRDRAVRLVREHRLEYPSLSAASAAVARHVGVGHESVRQWVLQADNDDGTRDGVSTAEHQEIKRLRVNRTGFGSVSFERMNHAASVSAGVPAACAQDA